jgi:hypothetical protein
VNRQSADFSRAVRLADTISDGRMRELFVDFIESVSSMHQDIMVQATDFEVRMMFKGSMLCRIVPYRELMHVQIGDQLAWEIRVRDDESWLEALDMAIRHSLRVVFSAQPASEHSCRRF